MGWLIEWHRVARTFRQVTRSLGADRRLRDAHPVGGFGWLALLLVRIAENATGETWRTLLVELDKLHLGRFAGPAGEVAQRTEITPRQAAIFKAFAVAEPPRYVALAPAAAVSA